MSIEFTRRAHTARALLVVALLGMLVAGCSTQEKAVQPATSAESASGSAEMVERAATGLDSALERFHSETQRLPQNASYDAEANALTLEGAGASITTVLDATASAAGVKLGWYVDQPDKRLGKAGTTDQGLGNFAYCLAGEDNHKVATGNSIASAAEVGEGPCPEAPARS